MTECDCPNCDRPIKEIVPVPYLERIDELHTYERAGDRCRLSGPDYDAFVVHRSR